MRRLGLVIASLALAIVATDIVLRVRPEYRPYPRFYVGQMTNRVSPNYAPDALLGWRMRPNDTLHWGGSSTVMASTYVSNAQGWRSPVDFSATCGKPRVILIGDSYIFGTGANYAQTIAARLADSLAHRADVYNMGMAGYGMDQMWMMLRHEALALCPSLLVVGFIDDDWNRSQNAFRRDQGFNKPTFVLDHDTLRPATQADTPIGPVKWIERHSAIWRLTTTAMRTWAYRTGHTNWFRLNAMLMAAMARDARAAGVPVLFVRWPNKRGAWRGSPALRVFMDSIGAPFIDLADPSLERHDIHFAMDDHLNARGVGYAASAILGWLRRREPPGLPGLPNP